MGASPPSQCFASSLFVPLSSFGGGARGKGHAQGTVHVRYAVACVCAFLAPQMTSEELTPTSKLWDAILLNSPDYSSLDDVKRAFPKLTEHHTLAFWSALASRGDDDAKATMTCLVHGPEVRGALTAYALPGESCALHA